MKKFWFWLAKRFAKKLKKIEEVLVGEEFRKEVKKIEEVLVGEEFRRFPVVSVSFGAELRLRFLVYF